jgi:DNA-nicking Smr family endonuclease
MADKFKVSDEDKALFREAVGKVTRVRHDRVQPSLKRVPPVPKQRRHDERQVMEDMLSDVIDPADVESGDELLFARPGIQHGVLRKLRRGQFSVDAELDMHGMTTVVARHALTEFLRTAQFSRSRCVRIIHGKGRGSAQGRAVLKNKVNYWLQQRDDVLAFCSARPVDGGTGAVYVLLKKM